jgi:Zn-dependent peptidase ImmA (M78 family)
MNWIKNILNGLIEFYETRDVNELIDSLGIILIKKDLSLGIKGKFLRDCWGTEYITISPDLELQEERYVLAHELGHAILHTDLSTEFLYGTHQVKNKFEIQANKFAAELLISDEIDIYELENMDTRKISSYLEVCEDLVEYKFNK